MNNEITAEQVKSVAQQLLLSEWQEGEIDNFSVPCYAKKHNASVLFIFDEPMVYNGGSYTRFAVGAKIGEFRSYININW